MSEMDSAEHYSKPENRRIVGPARRRERTSQLSNHVPIRFSPATMGWIRAIAGRDGVTVSSWIRTLVEREVERRLQFPRTAVTGYEVNESLNEVAPASAGTVNQAGRKAELTMELLAS